MHDHPVTEVLDTLDHLADSGPTSVGDGVRRFGDAGFETLLLVPAILLVSPLSGIPFFSTFCGVMIFLIAFQGAMGRDHVWLPDRVMKWELSAKQMHRAATSMAWLAEKLDSMTRERLHVLVSAGAGRALLTLCAVISPVFPFLELIPFSSSLMGGAVSLFAVALLAKDGLMVLAGFVALGIAAMVPFTVYNVVT